MNERRGKFELTELETYPFRIRLRPSNPKCGMNKDVVPWLNENVRWSGQWTLEYESSSIGPHNYFCQFHVASFEDAALVRLKFA